MRKVLISTTSFAKEDGRPFEMLRDAGLDIHVNQYGRKLTEAEALGLLFDMDYLIAGTEPLTRNVLESAGKLKIISRCGVGMDNVDLKAASQLGIKVFNTPYGPTQSVAELTVGLMLDLLRRITAMDRDVRKCVWKKRMGNLLRGKRIGIVGFGRIGQKVAEMLAPFGVELAYCDICACDCSLPASSMALDGLLAWADIVTLHCSASQPGSHLIGIEQLSKMKKGSWLVNASRGGLVDEQALYNALKEGHLAGAALDVFEKEPYNGPLAELDNVILTPHVGSYAMEGRIEMEIKAVENLLAGIRES
ncbi:MAG: phosphoglycerate dehydrogenase [Nitrospirae bacterium]|nr:phosphoglycerate dehydrogenase [Nitrospirota bacterium]